MKPYGDRRLRRSNRIEGLIREKETHILPHARELLFLALTSLVLLAYVADVGNAIKPATISGSASTPEHQRLTPDGQSRLRALVNSATLPDLRWPNFERYRTEVTQFYDSFGSLAWVQDSKPTPQARAIITILKGADLEGLRPKDYDGPNWNAHLAVFQQPLQPSEWDLIRFDVAITVSTMRYLSDLHLGRVNPRLFHFEFDTQGNAIALSDFLHARLCLPPRPSRPARRPLARRAAAHVARKDGLRAYGRGRWPRREARAIGRPNNPAHAPLARRRPALPRCRRLSRWSRDRARRRPA